MRNEGILNDFAREINTFVYFYDKFYWIRACGNPPGDFGFGGSLHGDTEDFLFHFPTSKAMPSIKVRAVPFSGRRAVPFSGRFLVVPFSGCVFWLCHENCGAAQKSCGIFTVGTFAKQAARVSRACDRPPKTRRNSRRQSFGAVWPPAMAALF